MIVIKCNLEICKIAKMFGMTTSDKFFWCNAFLACTNHNGRTMSIVCTNIDTLVPTKLLKTRPEIGL
jgi:hypothetical protein